MTRYVIDASVAIKWVVEEEGTNEALSVLTNASLSAPDLLIAECANILWKKVKRSELFEGEAKVAAKLLQGADIELLPTRHLLEQAMLLAVQLDHAAYDCIYLSLAMENQWQFVSADQSLKRKLDQSRKKKLKGIFLPLNEVSFGEAN